MDFLQWHPTWIYVNNQNVIFRPSLKTLNITHEVITLTPKDGFAQHQKFKIKKIKDLWGILMPLFFLITWNEKITFCLNLFQEEIKSNTLPNIPHMVIQKSFKKTWI
jgi:hypothetical protein